VSVFIYNLILAVLLCQEHGLPQSAVLLMPYVNSINRAVLWHKELPVEVPTSVFEFLTDTRIRKCAEYGS
jgi:hypothetical protein